MEPSTLTPCETQWLFPIELSNFKKLFLGNKLYLKIQQVQAAMLTQLKNALILFVNKIYKAKSFCLNVNEGKNQFKNGNK